MRQPLPGGKLNSKSANLREKFASLQIGVGVWVLGEGGGREGYFGFCLVGGGGGGGGWGGLVGFVWGGGGGFVGGGCFFWVCGGFVVGGFGFWVLGSVRGGVLGGSGVFFVPPWFGVGFGSGGFSWGQSCAQSRGGKRVDHSIEPVSRRAGSETV